MMANFIFSLFLAVLTVLFLQFAVHPMLDMFGNWNFDYSKSINDFKWTMGRRFLSVLIFLIVWLGWGVILSRSEEEES